MLSFLAVVALAASTGFAQNSNLSQLDAIKLLTGTWTLSGNSEVRSLTLVDENGRRSASCVLSSESRRYDYWSIYSNSFDFAAGTIQATNKDPFRNDNYRYRNLNRSSCEFMVGGEWYQATKGGSIQRPDVNNITRPSNGQTQRPANNGRANTPAGTAQRNQDNNSPVEATPVYGTPIVNAPYNNSPNSNNRSPVRNSRDRR